MLSLTLAGHNARALEHLLRRHGKMGTAEVYDMHGGANEYVRKGLVSETVLRSKANVLFLDFPNPVWEGDGHVHRRRFFVPGLPHVYHPLVKPRALDYYQDHHMFPRPLAGTLALPASGQICIAFMSSRNGPWRPRDRCT